MTQSNAVSSFAIATLSVSVHVASSPGPSQIPWLRDKKIKSGSGLGMRLLSMHELALSSDHMSGFKAIHTRSQCSQSLLQILRYIARKHNLCM